VEEQFGQLASAQAVWLVIINCLSTRFQARAAPRTANNCLYLTVLMTPLLRSLHVTYAVTDAAMRTQLLVAINDSYVSLHMCSEALYVG
jgi:hypothetical protein